MGLVQYSDNGLFAPRKIAEAFRTTSEEVARTAGLGRDAVQRKDRIRSDKTQRRLREMVEVINKIKYPYNLGTPSQALALKALENADSVKRSLDEIKKERSRLSKALSTFGCVKHVYPSDANFLLLKVDDATRLYTFLTENGTIIRNRTKEKGLEICVRITVGSRNENDILFEGFEAYMRKYYA